MRITESAAAHVAARMAEAITEFLDSLPDYWSGTAAELGAALDPFARRHFVHVPYTRLQPFVLDHMHAFEAAGWSVEFNRTKTRRCIVLSRGG
jgi:hypothetical protein